MSDSEDTKTTPPATDADKPLLLRRPSRPYDSTYHHHVVPTERCGALNVFVQGDLEEAHRDKDNKCVFLTVHDIGGNHKSFERFVDHYAFEEIKKRAIFVHIDCPGQEEDANDLDKPFPTIQALGEDLVTVLDQLRIKYCIGLGDGAGANVIVRFAMMHVTRTLGIILLNPTASTSTMMESFKDKLFAKLKMHNIQPGENPVYKRYSSKKRYSEPAIVVPNYIKKIPKLARVGFGEETNSLTALKYALSVLNLIFALAVPMIRFRKSCSELLSSSDVKVEFEFTSNPSELFGWRIVSKRLSLTSSVDLHESRLD